MLLYNRIRKPENKIATIVPVHHLDLIKDDEYFLALAHILNNGPEGVQYARFFYARAKESKYVILDNSAIENGGPGKFDDYFILARDIGATCIMLPDHFQDAQRTFDEAAEHMENYQALIRHHQMDVMVIPQGNDPREWLVSAAKLTQLVVDRGANPVLGISTRYVDMFEGTRAIPVLLSILTRPNISALRIHLLGCYKDPRKDVAPLLHLPFIQGVDSSYPAIYAQHGMELNEDTISNRPPRNIDFVHDRYDEKLLKRNIHYWKQSCIMDI